MNIREKEDGVVIEDSTLAGEVVQCESNNNYEISGEKIFLSNEFIEKEQVAIRDREITVFGEKTTTVKINLPFEATEENISSLEINSRVFENENVEKEELEDSKIPYDIEYSQNQIIVKEVLLGDVLSFTVDCKKEENASIVITDVDTIVENLRTIKIDKNIKIKLPENIEAKLKIVVGGSSFTKHTKKNSSLEKINLIEENIIISIGRNDNEYEGFGIEEIEVIPTEKYKKSFEFKSYVKEVDISKEEFRDLSTVKLNLDSIFINKFSFELYEYNETEYSNDEIEKPYCQKEVKENCIIFKKVPKGKIIVSKKSSRSKERYKISDNKIEVEDSKEELNISFELIKKRIKLSVRSDTKTILLQHKNREKIIDTNTTQLLYLEFQNEDKKTIKLKDPISSKTKKIPIEKESLKVKSHLYVEF